MNDHQIDEYSGEGFTEEERKILRKMIDTEKHLTWFWATIRCWAFWTAIVVAGIVTFRENMKAIFLWFVK